MATWGKADKSSGLKVADAADRLVAVYVRDFLEQLVSTHGVGDAIDVTVFEVVDRDDVKLLGSGPWFAKVLVKQLRSGVGQYRCGRIVMAPGKSYYRMDDPEPFEDDFITDAMASMPERPVEAEEKDEADEDNGF